MTETLVVLANYHPHPRPGPMYSVAVHDTGDPEEVHIIFRVHKSGKMEVIDDCLFDPDGLDVKDPMLIFTYIEMILDEGELMDREDAEAVLERVYMEDCQHLE
jgi:hypothetical protein